MALRSIIVDKKGGAWLNSIKRYALSAIVVPRQALAIAKIPAGSATSPGRSPIIPIQGPADAATELYSLTGKQGVVNQGIGVITSTGGDVNVTGVGTKFTSQLQKGDTIATAAGTGTIDTVTTDTTATTLAPLAANTNANYFFSTAIMSTQPYGDVTVTIEDQAWRRKLMNRDVPVEHVFGSNIKPLFMKESPLQQTDQSLLLQFLNYSGQPASFAPISEGRKWQYEALKYPDVNKFIQGMVQRKVYIQPYWLTMDRRISTLGTSVGSSTVELFTCTGDITLVLFNVYADAVDASFVDQSANVSVELTDPKTQRSMQVQPMPLNCCTGTAENPFRLPTPWIVEPQTFITATFRTLAGMNSAVRVAMTFHGVAIYTGSSFRGSTLNNAKLIDEAAKMYAAMSTPEIRPASQQE